MIKTKPHVLNMSKYLIDDSKYNLINETRNLLICYLRICKLRWSLITGSLPNKLPGLWLGPASSLDLDSSSSQKPEQPNWWVGTWVALYIGLGLDWYTTFLLSTCSWISDRNQIENVQNICSWFPEVNDWQLCGSNLGSEQDNGKVSSMSRWCSGLVLFTHNSFQHPLMSSNLTGREKICFAFSFCWPELTNWCDYSD